MLCDYLFRCALEILFNNNNNNNNNNDDDDDDDDDDGRKIEHVGDP